MSAIFLITYGKKHSFSPFGFGNYLLPLVKLLSERVPSFIITL